MNNILKKQINLPRTKMVNDPTPGVKGYYKNGKYVFIAPEELLYLLENSKN
ncbi:MULTISPECIES: hypothetical protein [unclassified Enterococcus]|uniref:hypothetical protein n=1 Tax=unclassified Enterococcus TaxID=2608891 RepID=UPI001CE1EF33|nr:MULTISPECIES: hypothetical protein [unclassified Enterococcus]MCA5017469.1 hypothetical protein [Enterococcus sp. S22(2020)]